MNSNYLNAIANHGASLITHIALVDGTGAEVGDGRKAVSWTAAVDGLTRPTEDLTFIVGAGENVNGWRGFSAETGGTAYGGAELGSVTFNNSGEYTLVADQTGIDHSTAV